MRGDVYLADLNPSRGSEQAGVRPVIIVVVIPVTTNLRRSQIPGTIFGASTQALDNKI